MKRQTKPKSLDNTTYNRLVGKDSDDEETTELITLPKSTFKEIQTIDKELEEGDTLQNLAIRYHSTIHDLKRINKIQNENEIYAKRYIKVPYRPFAMLLAANNMASVHNTSGSTSPTMADYLTVNGDCQTDENNLKSFNNILDIDRLENSLLTIPIPTDPNACLNAVIFNSSVSTNQNNNTHLIPNLSPPEPDITHQKHQITSPLLPITPVDDVDLTATSVGIKNKERVRKQNWLLWDGADADISWIALIACVVVLILAVPLIYVLYIAEHPDLYHHEHHHNKTSLIGHDLHN